MIDDYIKYISLKRKELGGHAICPFAKKFLDKTEIIKSDDLESDALNCIESKERPMLWLIYGCPKKFTKEWLSSFCDKHKDKAKVSELDIHNLIKFFSNKKEFANHFEILGGK